MSHVIYSPGYLAALRFSLDAMQQQPTALACQPAAVVRAEMERAEKPLGLAKRAFRSLLRRRIGGAWDMADMEARFIAMAEGPAVKVWFREGTDGHQRGGQFEVAFFVREDGKVGEVAFGGLPHKLRGVA